MIIWPKVLPRLSNQKKTKPRRPPEHHKISLQQFFTKLNPLAKKSMNYTTKLNLVPEIQKIFDEQIIF